MADSKMKKEDPIYPSEPSHEWDESPNFSAKTCSLMENFFCKKEPKRCGGDHPELLGQKSKLFKLLMERSWTLVTGRKGVRLLMRTMTQQTFCRVLLQERCWAQTLFQWCCKMELSSRPNQKTHWSPASSMTWSTCSSSPQQCSLEQRSRTFSSTTVFLLLEGGSITLSYGNIMTKCFL